MWVVSSTHSTWVSFPVRLTRVGVYERRMSRWAAQSSAIMRVSMGCGQTGRVSGRPGSCSGSSRVRFGDDDACAVFEQGCGVAANPIVVVHACGEHAARVLVRVGEDDEPLEAYVVAPVAHVDGLLGDGVRAETPCDVAGPWCGHGAGEAFEFHEFDAVGWFGRSYAGLVAAACFRFECSGHAWGQAFRPVAPVVPVCAHAVRLCVWAGDGMVGDAGGDAVPGRVAFERRGGRALDAA